MIFRGPGPDSQKNCPKWPFGASPAALGRETGGPKTAPNADRSAPRRQKSNTLANLGGILTVTILGKWVSKPHYLRSRRSPRPPRALLEPLELTQERSGSPPQGLIRLLLELPGCFEQASDSGRKGCSKRLFEEAVRFHSARIGKLRVSWLRA